MKTGAELYVVTLINVTGFGAFSGNSVIFYFDFLKNYDLRGGCSLKFGVSRHVSEDSIYKKTIGQNRVKSIHFWKALCTGFSKIPKSLP